MKKSIALSAITVGLISTSVLNAADDLSTMFADGKVSGQIRSFYVDREYQGGSGSDAHRNAQAIGGHLKFVTDDYAGLKFGAAFYTTNGFLLNSPKSDFSQNDMTLLGHNNESYTILGEAFLEYKYENTSFKGGRVKYNSPMMGADDARMLPNLFEAYELTNTDIDGLKLSIVQVTKFAQGSFGRVYNGGLLAATSGYSPVNSRPTDSGKFEDIGSYATGVSNSGVTVASLEYTGIENLKLRLYDYYADDIANTIYGDVSYSWKCLLSDKVKSFAAAQFISQTDVGDKTMSNALGGNGEIDSFYLAVKIGAKYKGFTAYLAHSQTTDNDAGETYQNAILTMWGGMPAYTQGMVTRHQFLAGTEATKVVGAYSFKEHGINLSAAAYYTSFDMDANSGYGISRTATEPGFDIKYYPKQVKNLQLRFRGNFPRNFAESTSGNDTGWNEYRFIVNYNF